jgi:hypothetical protein
MGYQDGISHQTKLERSNPNKSDAVGSGGTSFSDEFIFRIVGKNSLPVDVAKEVSKTSLPMEKNQVFPLSLLHATTRLSSTAQEIFIAPSENNKIPDRSIIFPE